MIRPTPAEKLEIIHLVESSALSVKQTLEELEIVPSTFYRWYGRYLHHGQAGLHERSRSAKQFWNRIPQHVKDQVVHLALTYPEKSARQLAWYFTDTQGYFISESSVYRIPKGFVLLPRRWVVERSFGWMARFRRLVRDYEHLPETLAGLHFLAFAIPMLHRFVQCVTYCL